MFKKVDLQRSLQKLRKHAAQEDESLLQEARKILQRDLFTEKKILENLGQYNRRNEVLDEETLDEDLVFSKEEIRRIAVRHRLRFLPGKFYEREFPYEAILTIKRLNSAHHKELKHFFVLSTVSAFNSAPSQQSALLFVLTNYDNYYLVHSWGKQLSAWRRIQYWPMQRFENLLVTVILFTLVLTLSLPTWLITLDAKATYWSGYRAAAFFHLLIFNMGFTAFLTFAFSRNFSGTVWNRKQDFD